MKPNIKHICMGMALAIGTATVAKSEESLKWKGPGEVRYTITANGLSSIHVGDRQVAKGGWYAFNAGPGWFKRGTTAAGPEND